MKRITILAALLLLLTGTVFADSIADKRGEFTFAASYSDGDGVTNANVTGGLLVVFAGGHLEAGPMFGYSEIRTADFEADGMSTGARVVFNFIPNHRLSPFAFATYSMLDGDLNDLVDESLELGGGIRIFVGANASVNFEYSRAELTGADGFEDLTVNQGRAGISLFF